MTYFPSKPQIGKFSIESGLDWNKWLTNFEHVMNLTLNNMTE